MEEERYVELLGESIQIDKFKYTGQYLLEKIGVMSIELYHRILFKLEKISGCCVIRKQTVKSMKVIQVNKTGNVVLGLNMCISNVGHNMGITSTWAQGNKMDAQKFGRKDGVK